MVRPSFASERTRSFSGVFCQSSSTSEMVILLVRPLRIGHEQSLDLEASGRALERDRREREPFRRGPGHASERLVDCGEEVARPPCPAGTWPSAAIRVTSLRSASSRSPASTT